MRIEWRSRSSGKGDDVLLAVREEGSTVVKAWAANPDLITDFLNDMDDLDADKGPNGLDLGQRNPQDWGALVLARSDNGGILHVDPELYWDQVTYWFRARGDDPHVWSRTR